MATKTKRHKPWSGYKLMQELSKSFCQMHGAHKISMSKILLIVIIYKKN